MTEKMNDEGKTGNGKEIGSDPIRTRYYLRTPSTIIVWTEKYARVRRRGFPPTFRGHEGKDDSEVEGREVRPCGSGRRGKGVHVLSLLSPDAHTYRVSMGESPWL